MFDVKSRAGLIAAAREVHVPGQVEVDMLCHRLASELEAVTARRVPEPREITVADLRVRRHPDGHPLELKERAWFASYTAAHNLGVGHVDSARYATRQVYGEEALA